MSPEESTQVGKMLLAMAELFDKELSEPAIDLYLTALAPYPFDKIMSAAGHIIKTKTFNKFPLPAEFIEHIDPPEQSQIKSNEAWRTVIYAIEAHGYVATVQFTDAAITQTILAMASTWPEFCNRTRCDDNEFKWLQKEFEQRYAAYAKMGALRNQALIGWIDAENGEKKPMPVLIGEPKRILIEQAKADIPVEVEK